MKKIVLANGVALVFKEKNSDKCDLSITIKCGHINEPKLGVAAVYENIVQQDSSNVISICGGNITSFYTGTTEDKLDECFSLMFHWCYEPKVNDYTVNKAIEDIVQHTKDLAPLPWRQAKLAYKHTAFSHNKVVWDTPQYIKAIKSITEQDVKNYISRAFTTGNVVIGFSCRKEKVSTMLDLIKKYCSVLQNGYSENRNVLYTGGYQEIESIGKTQIAMFGWDISAISAKAEANVLMSILLNRLERELSQIPATLELKIAGYFGFRTMRICVQCEDKKKFQDCIDIVCWNIKRLQSSLASDRRMETATQNAMTQRLFISNSPQPSSVEIAWQLLGRNTEYDTDAAITDTWNVTARDVKDVAEEIFSKTLTCVLYSNVKHDCYNKIIAK